MLVLNNTFILNKVTTFLDSFPLIKGNLMLSLKTLGLKTFAILGKGFRNKG